MKKRNLLIFIFVLGSVILNGQFARVNQDSIRNLTQTDYKKMLELVKVSATRQGPSGTPTAPNAANNDESKATQYKTLPDPLVFNDGKPVKTASDWYHKRRAEIVELFDREIYGRVPKNVPMVTWEVVKTSNDTVAKILVVTKKLIGRVDNSSYPKISVNIDLTLVTPANATKPVPVIMEFGFAMPAGGFRRPAAATNNQTTNANTNRPQAAAPTRTNRPLMAATGS
jgi:hypothetical protein